ncbi:MAG TPA: hypothetical protein DCZ94_03695 [Lentisphaeria bacterium]|nr:MAG: hypothetical protein A2X48_02320 [Lentisphaerae bacterium GWF2_49_21]HBC86037.1 hypothetical protein [Lentisphaeria bacterium]
MSGYDIVKTRETLIMALKQDDEKAWAVFYELYAPVIINFARKRGCPKELAEDVLQETTMVLMRYLKNFQYDRKKGRFKSLLFKITESKVIDAFRRAGKISRLRNSELFSKATSEDHARIITERENIWDNEWKTMILRESLQEAKKRVNSRVFKCFEEVYLKEKSVEEVAEQLKVSPNLLAQNKFRVMKIIVDTAKKMIHNLEKS